MDDIIRKSLSEFTEYVFRAKWYGRERETVSFYVLGFLQRFCSPNHLLRECTQIGIEAAVPQLKEPGRKPQVCKDLVIWPMPKMTCWNRDKQPVHYPVAIMEWKTDRASISKHDVEWLQKYSMISEITKEFRGYAVSLDLSNRKFRLSCTRIHQGNITPEWLIL